MKNVVITGASSGIGAALAKGYGAEGAHVLITARRATELEDIAEQVRQAGGEPIAVVADLSVESECQRVIDMALDRMTSVDVLVNNAGRGHHHSVEDTGTSEWRDMFKLNVDAPFFLIRGILPSMKRADKGHIINIASVAGTTGFPFNPGYVAAKHALVGLNAAVRAELVGTNVHCTVINPAGVKTEWGDVTQGGSTNDLYAKAIPRSRTVAKEKGLPLAPLSKMMSAEDVAAVVMDVVKHGRTNDVFTHDGTRELAVRAIENRIDLEDQHQALWESMREFYQGTD